MAKVTRTQVLEEEFRSNARQVKQKIAELEAFVRAHPSPCCAGVLESLREMWTQVQNNLINGVPATDEDAGKGID